MYLSKKRQQVDEWTCQTFSHSHQQRRKREVRDLREKNQLCIFTHHLTSHFKEMNNTFLVFPIYEIKNERLYTWLVNLDIKQPKTIRFSLLKKERKCSRLYVVSKNFFLYCNFCFLLYYAKSYNIILRLIKLWLLFYVRNTLFVCLWFS